jgi:hypothetical protein
MSMHRNSHIKKIISQHNFENALMKEDMVMPTLQKTSSLISQTIKERVHQIHEAR